MSSPKHYDVIISGAGLSGLLTAIGLVKETNNLSIALVEPYDAKTTPERVANFDDRCLALSYGSLQLFDHWGIWPKLKPSAWPIKTIVTSDRGHLGKTVMRAGDYGLNAMGYVAAMRNMGVAFEQTLQALLPQSNCQIDWYKPNKIEQLAQTQQQVHITLDDQQQLTGQLLVVAEGGNSPTRTKLHIESSRDEYNQAAVISNVTVSGNKGLDKVLSRDGSAIQPNVAFERFTTCGPIAFLPIGDNQYSVVWSVLPERVEDVLAMDQAAFCQALQQAFGNQVGDILTATKQEAYPLALVKANTMVSHRVALVGNAGHTVHPIAGQGFNLGLRDIAVLVKRLASAIEEQRDIGSHSVLAQYDQARKPDIDRITGFTDLLVRGFALEGRLAAGTRTAALQALQKCDSLQQWLALHFMSSRNYNN